MNIKNVVHHISENIYNKINLYVEDGDTGESYQDLYLSLQRYIVWDDYLAAETQIKFLNRFDSGYYMEQTVQQCLPDYNFEDHVVAAFQAAALQFIEEHKDDIKAVIIGKELAKIRPNADFTCFNKINFLAVSDNWEEGTAEALEMLDKYIAEYEKETTPTT